MTHTLSRRRRNYHRYQAETLETRTLMSVTAEFSTVPGVFPIAGAYDTASGHLWVVDATSGSLMDLDGAASYDISSVGFNNGLAIAGGHAYLTDYNGGIHDFDLSDGSSRYTQLTSNFAQTPMELVVTSNAIWFTCQGDFPSTSGVTNYVGRWVPGTGTADFQLLDDTLTDSYAFSIAASGADSVWVGMVGLDNEDFSGQNHLVFASYAAGFSTTAYAVNSGDPIADANNQLTSVASDGNGGVWYNLTQTAAHPTLRTQFGPETIVHLSGATQTAYQVSTDANEILNTRNLTLDPDGRLWFNELTGIQAGYLDTGTGNFDLVDYPAGTETPNDLIVNPNAAEASVLTAPADSTAPLVILTVDTEVTFSGETYDLSGQEDAAFNNTLLATFTAPPLGVGEEYVATITWGDGTTSVVTSTSLPGTTYVVVINSKTFVTQGTYAGSISIAPTDSASIGTLTFTSHISDIPLNVTSFSVTPLLFGIMAAVGTFTDDSGLPLSSFTSTINWGDSTSSTGVIVRDPTQAGRYLVLGAHWYRVRGDYSVTLTVTTTEANAEVTNSSLTTSVSA